MFKSVTEAAAKARQAELQANEKRLIKRERKALKRSANSPVVYLQSYGKRDMMVLCGRGWVVAPEINSLRGGVSTQAMVKMDRAMLEARLG